MNTRTFSLTLANESYTNMLADIQPFCKKILVRSRIERKKQHLIFHYRVDLPIVLLPFITWQNFNITSVKHADYLWQHSCLECFLGNHDNPEYIEINASPKGEFAVYHFDGYRTPDTLPPRPLWVDNDEELTVEHAKIDWKPCNEDTAKTLFQRTFSFEISQLPKTLNTFDLINPCVILYCHGQPLFFSTQHAIPADFHNKNYWQSFR